VLLGVGTVAFSRVVRIKNEEHKRFSVTWSRGYMKDNREAEPQTKKQKQSEYKFFSDLMKQETPLPPPLCPDVNSAPPYLGLGEITRLIRNWPSNNIFQDLARSDVRDMPFEFEMKHQKTSELSSNIDANVGKRVTQSGISSVFQKCGG